MAWAQSSIPLLQPATGVDALRVEVNGQVGLYMFDSGWGVSAVTPSTARAVGCTPWGKITGFRATGERIDEQRCNAAELKIGATRRHIGQLGVIDLAKYMGDAASEFSGGVGLDAFDGQILTLSVSRRLVTVETRESLSKIAAEGVEVPIRLVRDSQGAALTADIGVPTSSGVVWLEVDTGNYGPSRIDTRAAALLGLDPGVRGRQSLDVQVSGKVRFGGAAVVGDLIMDGNVGRDALKRWDITLDLTRGRGWLRPAANIGP